MLDRCCSAGVRVVILRSSPGVRVWSSGHDVRDFKRVDGSNAQSSGGSKFQDPLSSGCQLGVGIFFLYFFFSIVNGVPVFVTVSLFVGPRNVGVGGHPWLGRVDSKG